VFPFALLKTPLAADWVERERGGGVEAI
jgi:hypothetical protein